MKVIKNLCSIGSEECVLKVDGRHFGYDRDPAYPESFYKNIEEAYVFNNVEYALSITTWLSGEEFVILPVTER